MKTGVVVAPLNGIHAAQFASLIAPYELCRS
jgi:hypothetical protein